MTLYILQITLLILTCLVYRRRYRVVGGVTVFVLSSSVISIGIGSLIGAGIIGASPGGAGVICSCADGVGFL